MLPLWQESWLSARALGRNRLFSAVVVIVLTFGLGINIAVFNILDLLMLQRLPVEDPKSLVLLRWQSSKTPPPDILSFWFGFNQATVFSLPAYDLIRSHTHTLASFFGFADVSLGSGSVVAKVNGRGVLVAGQVVTAEYFSGLGILPAAGRWISPEDDKANAAPVVVISNSFATRMWGHVENALGQTMYIEAVPYVIVGVARPDFYGVESGLTPDFWEPLAQWPFLRAKPDTMPINVSSPTTWFITLVGRLKPGVSAEQAQSELATLFQQSTSAVSSQLKPEEAPHLELRPAGRGTSSVRERFSRYLVILVVVVGLGLLSACINVGLLMMARARSRAGEMAVRLALGAQRSRLVRQMVIEAMLLTGISVLMGTMLAFWVSKTFLVLVSGILKPLGLSLHPGQQNLAVIWFALGLAVLITLACSTVPALLITKVNVASTLAENRWSGKPGSGWWRISGGRLLVIGQIAVSLVVITGASFFVQTLRNLKNEDLGFNPQSLILFNVNAMSDEYKGASLADLYLRIQDQMKNIPGVKSVTSSLQPPISSVLDSVPVTFYGDERLPNRTEDTGINLVGPDFFETMQIALEHGHALGGADVRASRGLAVVNESLVRKSFHGQDPIGKHFNFGANTKDFEIVGVVRDSKYASVKELNSPIVYIPYLQFPALLSGSPLGMHFELRLARPGAQASVVGAIHKNLESVDPDLPFVGVRTELDQINSSLVHERILALLSSVLGLFVVLLAGTSIYGVQSHLTERRVHEIGIRMSLGATRWQILRLVGRGSLLAAFVGIAFGIAASFFGSRLIASQLYGVTSNDPATMISSAAVLLGVAMLAGYVPCRRAMKVEPTVALRQN